jgi:hypothetical protein
MPCQALHSKLGGAQRFCSCYCKRDPTTTRKYREREREREKGIVLFCVFCVCFTLHYIVFGGFDSTGNAPIQWRSDLLSILHEFKHDPTSRSVHNKVFGFALTQQTRKTNTSQSCLGKLSSAKRS